MKSHSKNFKLTAFVLAAALFFTSCASTTMIRTAPEGAKLYLNDEAVGTTPYMHSDTKIILAETRVRIEKEGYEPLYTTFSRDEEIDVGALIGGIFFTIPYLWILKYKPIHYYELVPLEDSKKDVLETLNQKDIIGRDHNDTSKVNNPVIKVIK